MLLKLNVYILQMEFLKKQMEIKYLKQKKIFLFHIKTAEGLKNNKIWINPTMNCLNALILGIRYASYCQIFPKENANVKRQILYNILHLKKSNIKVIEIKLVNIRYFR